MRCIQLLLMTILILNVSPKVPKARRLQRGRGRANALAEVGQCDSSLLRSFNLFGRNQARPTSLEVCPHVFLSCCTRNDQIAIYDNWVTDNEEQSLIQKFEAYTSTIDKFFEQAEIATDTAAKVLDYMSQMQNNECKLMARRIVSYQVSDLRRTLISNFRGTYEFFTNAHKGLYCSLCDANSHIYFQADAKKIQISEQFCRSFVENTVTTLMYLRVHIPKFVNLLSLFMGSCDSKGRYLQKTLPQGVFATIDTTTEKYLGSCFKGRNTATWLTNCQSICQKWTPGKLNPFFAPDTEQLKAAVDHIMSSLEKFDIEQPSGDSSSRILREKTRKTTKKFSRGTSRRGPTDAPEPRRLQRSGSASGQYPQGNDTHDAFGNPNDFLNFTRNGTNKTAINQIIRNENSFSTQRSGISVNPASNIVYQSQNLTFAPSMSDWVVEVSPEGANLYLAAQYSVITMDAVDDLIQAPSTQTTANTTSKRARKLKNAPIVSAFVAFFAVLITHMG